MSEQDIRERLTAAKAKRDTSRETLRAHYAWRKRLASDELELSMLNEAEATAELIAALEADNASLRTQLAAAEQARDAAVAAQVEWEDLSYMSVASLADGLIQLSVEPGQYGGYSASVQGATRITKHGYTKLEGAKRAALELAMERMAQAARQPDDAAEGSG